MTDSYRDLEGMGEGCKEKGETSIWVEWMGWEEWRSEDRLGGKYA